MADVQDIGWKILYLIGVLLILGVIFNRVAWFQEFVRNLVGFLLLVIAAILAFVVGYLYLKGGSGGR